MSDRFGRSRHSSCAKTAMSRRPAFGTARIGLGRRAEGHRRGKTTGDGPRGPTATWPTIEVCVLVNRRSLLRSR